MDSFQQQSSASHQYNDWAKNEAEQSSGREQLQNRRMNKKVLRSCNNVDDAILLGFGLDLIVHLALFAGFNIAP